MTNFFNQKITIYNDIPADTVNPRTFRRTVVGEVNVQGADVQTAQGTVTVITNQKSVILRDLTNYKNAVEFAKIPRDMIGDNYTVSVGDFIVFDEVSDVVTTAQEFATLQKKYKDNGMIVKNVSEYRYGRRTDNVMVS